MSQQRPSALWQREAGYAQRHVQKQGVAFDTVAYRVPAAEALSGRRLLYFSDIHWRSKTGLIIPELLSMIADLEPDWLVFGGDLVSSHRYLPEVADFFQKLPYNGSRIAVFGNWEWRMSALVPRADIISVFELANFRLLVNDECDSEGLHFYGLDDIKLGKPKMAMTESELPTVLLAHNPDTVVDKALTDSLKNVSLVLCGHTHGGQVCLPWFGALKTSSKYWKRFEYGSYRHRETGTQMIVSSGLGTSCLPVRFLRRPEIVLVEFASDS